VESWIVLLRRALVVHIGLEMITGLCNRNLADDPVNHIQSQEAAVEALADIPVPLRQIVVEVRIDFPGAVVGGDAVLYSRDVRLEEEVGAVHIRLEASEEVRIDFRHAELLTELVSCVLTVYVGTRTEEAVVHIHQLACEEVRIEFLYSVIMALVVAYKPIVYCETQKGVAHILPLDCQGVRMHFLDD
jgi:hypothetical protein